MAMTADQRALFGAVAGDVPRVEELLHSVAKVEQPWLRRMLEATLSSEGKRLRPAMALLAGHLGEYDLNRVAPLAASVELLHTATLVHDDVIDGATERRGQPTAGALFGNAASVMIGDYMFAAAAGLIASTDSTRVVRIFSATLQRMAGGELTQDVSAFEYSEDVQRYLDRISGKTASLFATSAEGGAILCDASEEHVSAARHYGQAVGMAFQIVDDILDFAGDAEVMGKPVGSDLLAGTLTLPSIIYMQRHPGENRVRRAFSGVRRRSNLNRAVEEIRSSDILDEARQTASQYGEAARAALGTLPEGETRATLTGLIDHVLSRDH